jgi:hypothetical protein
MWGAHGGSYKQCGLLGSNAVQFRRNIPPPSSGLKSRMRQGLLVLQPTVRASDNRRVWSIGGIIIGRGNRNAGRDLPQCHCAHHNPTWAALGMKPQTGGDHLSCGAGTTHHCQAEFRRAQTVVGTHASRRWVENREKCCAIHSSAI